MNPHRRTTLVSSAALATALWLLGGCNEIAQGGRSSSLSSKPWSGSVLSGTTIAVALASNISSETAHVGDAWHGTVTENVMGHSGGVIPPGSEVTGVVTGVASAQPGSLAMLALGVRSIRVYGEDEPIAASAEPVIAVASVASVVAALKGYQVVLPDGTVMRFTVSQTVAMR